MLVDTDIVWVLCITSRLTKVKSDDVVIRRYCSYNNNIVRGGVSYCVGSFYLFFFRVLLKKLISPASYDDIFDDG